DREAKKEAFRKYLESSGVLDTLTKVLVALYEENDKPSSAVEFVQQKLGGPSISDYEKLKAEKLDLQLKYNELLETHKETCRQVSSDKETGSLGSRGRSLSNMDYHLIGSLTYGSIARGIYISTT
ncbi:hypothetical protein E2562_030212, partial [Oryza meyeriana var. granulata]